MYNIRFLLWYAFQFDSHLFRKRIAFFCRQVHCQAATSNDVCLNDPILGIDTFSNFNDFHSVSNFKIDSCLASHYKFTNKFRRKRRQRFANWTIEQLCNFLGEFSVIVWALYCRWSANENDSLCKWWYYGCKFVITLNLSVCMSTCCQAAAAAAATQVLIIYFPIYL